MIDPDKNIQVNSQNLKKGTQQPKKQESLNTLVTNNSQQQKEISIQRNFSQPSNLTQQSQESYGQLLPTNNNYQKIKINLQDPLGNENTTRLATTATTTTQINNTAKQSITLPNNVQTRSNRSTRSSTRRKTQQSQITNQNLDLILKGSTVERKRELTNKNYFNEQNETNNQKFLNRRRINSQIVENGKELFKLLTGLLWVISGGAAQKILTPFTNIFANKIGTILNGNQDEVLSIKSQLKYLLSNSRRTLTEFILEILVGVLSLAGENSKNKLAVELWQTIEGLVELNENDQEQDQDQNSTTQEDNEKTSNRLKRKLEQVYQQIFTHDVLMYWFTKRFVDRLEPYFSLEEQKKFFDQHLFFLGKSKFILSCLLLGKELVQKNGITQGYRILINLPYENNPLNLYLNNRGKKVNLVKELITKYGVNNGNYWEIISKDYLNKMKFNTQNIFLHFPFKGIITNSKLANLSQSIPQEEFIHQTEIIQKRDEPHMKITAEWLKK
ncbi:hypothetical protein M0812_25783 [Anaeramoeba flamelloides]|uniref:Uncharacterized protein n=1 Tax=Anaeramoeba flamelloides TaxID=1746091 RepID=A0AAV7YGZ1_9EUKA|nr:hypothetical protein M0812_25783 [Anaeramoeba flamelloides]